MSESTITASQSIVLARAPYLGRSTWTLSQFDGERYLLTVNTGDSQWQFHLDQAGIEQLRSLLAIAGQS